MEFRLIIGHLAAGLEELNTSAEKAADALDALLNELHRADDDHYQVYVVNSAHAAVTVYDGGLMVYSPTPGSPEPANLYHRPATRAEAVGILTAHVRQQPDGYLPRFSPTKPPPGPNFVLADMGAFVLHAAANAGNLKMVERLVGGGSDVNRRDADGATPILHAANEGHLEVCRFLIKSGADVTVRDKDGEGLRGVASEYPEIVALLKRAGAPK